MPPSLNDSSNCRFFPLNLSEFQKVGRRDSPTIFLSIHDELLSNGRKPMIGEGEAVCREIGDITNLHSVTKLLTRSKYHLQRERIKLA